MAFIDNGEDGLSVRSSLNARFDVVALTPAGGFISTDASVGAVFDVTVFGNVTLSTPTGASDGQFLTWNFLHSGDGNVIATTSDFVFPDSPQISQAVDAVDGTRVILSVRYRSATGKFNVENVLVQTP